MGTVWTLVENYHLKIKIWINSYCYGKLTVMDRQRNFLTDLHINTNINYFQKIIMRSITISSPLATVKLYWGRKMSKSRSPFVDMRVQNNFLEFKNDEKITALFNGVNFLCIFFTLRNWYDARDRKFWVKFVNWNFSLTIRV